MKTPVHSSALESYLAGVDSAAAPLVVALDHDAREIENASVDFVTSHGIRALPSERVDEIEGLVREVAAGH